MLHRKAPKNVRRGHKALSASFVRTLASARRGSRAQESTTYISDRRVEGCVFNLCVPLPGRKKSCCSEQLYDHDSDIVLICYIADACKIPSENQGDIDKKPSTSVFAHLMSPRRHDPWYTHYCFLTILALLHNGEDRHLSASPVFYHRPSRIHRALLCPLHSAKHQTACAT